MKRLMPFLLLFAIPALSALDEISFARRVRCEVQNADGRSLDRLTFQQGTTPLISCDVFRNGRPISIDTTVQARVLIGSSATASVYVVATNYAVTNNSYLVQLPTIGTNSASAPNGLWWYTVYFDLAGHTFWTGSGELVIEKTTSTEDGMVWQEITTSASVAAHNTNVASHADIRTLVSTATSWATNAYVQITNHLAQSWTLVHGGYIKTAFDHGTNALAIAQAAFGWGDHSMMGYITGIDVDDWETDPIFGAWYAHGFDGVITSETDPVFTNWASTNAYIVTSTNLAAQDAAGKYVPTSRTITINGGTGTLNSNLTFNVTPDSIGAVSTNAPLWIASTNTDLAITITNDQERPQYLYATGAVTLAFSGLRPPQPFYLIVSGPDSLTFPSNTHFVGGASWQTNQANHFIVWQTGTNLFVNPVTTSEIP